MASISKLTTNEVQSDRRSIRSEGAASHRRRPLRVLFVHRDADAVDSCVQELEKAHFIVSSDSVLNLAHCAARLHSQSFDVVVAEYPNPSWKGSESLQLLQQTLQDVPLVFVTLAIGSKSMAELSAWGAFDYLEAETRAQLRMAIRRALNERQLRAELEEAGKALRHSQSLYRALADNPAFGICLCDAQAKFLDVNQALVTMLGYDNKEELLEANRACEIVLDLGHVAPLGGLSRETMRIEPVEIAWKRKNGTELEARLS